MLDITPQLFVVMQKALYKEHKLIQELQRQQYQLHY